MHGSRRGTASKPHPHHDPPAFVRAQDIERSLRNATADIDIVDLLPRVSIPTLILHSRYDNAVPFEEGRRLASSIPNARFVALESENHVPMPDEPAWPTFVEEIEAFLRN